MNAPTCPHCRKPLTDLWDHDWRGDDEDEFISTDCGKCERPIIIKRSVRVSYSVELP